MRIGNNIAFRRILREGSGESVTPATYKGITLKTLFFLFLTVASAIGGLIFGSFYPEAYVIMLVVASIATLILSIISMISIKACKITGSLYCVAEGLLIGIISYAVSFLYEGAVSVAILSTILVFAVVTLLYVSNIVKVNNKFMKFLSIFAFSFIIFMVFYSIYSWITGSWAGFGLSLLISIVSIFLATLYLFFDLEKIRQIVEGGYDKSLEWNAAFGLAFTLIWLYVEILRLVLIVADRRS